MTKRQAFGVSRREVLHWGAAALALPPLSMRSLVWAQPVRGPLQAVLPLNDSWTFRADDAPAARAQPACLPHTVVNLSWQGWEPERWQRVWRYQRSFPSPIPPGSGARAFLHFDGVMSAAQATLNGAALEPYMGGFLPFEREITPHLAAQNELDVLVDGRWLNAPPEGGPRGYRQIDYLLPAGLCRNVSLRVVPQCFIADVFAKPVQVLTADRALSMLCTIDAGQNPPDGLRLAATLTDGSQVIGRAQTAVAPRKAGPWETEFTMTGLAQAGLWEPAAPRLYTLKVALYEGAQLRHTYRTRVGLREAHFTVEGFFLNGKQVRLFGLNRHELFPYTGFAMPDRVMRHDAEMLRRELNCNAVRCSHYPQSEAFLDACDELGMMVWEEVPGWQYLGDDAWQQLLLRDVEQMVRRDRNHPSVIVWGVRVNESHNDVPLYTQTKQLALSLDDSRQTSGTMTTRSTADWVQEVFAYDDYAPEPDGSVLMYPPTPGVPFLFTEAVGQFAYMHGGGFKQYYRRAGDRETFAQQALFHAQGHDRGADDPRVAGVIAWCAFDYASGINGYNMVKCPGVVDVFRMPKLGAAFYQSQVSPTVKPVIAPGFFWDFTHGSLRGQAWVYANCEQLRVRVGAGPAATIEPARAAFPHTAYPPFLVDLSGAHAGDSLQLEALVGGHVVLTRRFSSDRSRDQLIAGADDGAIVADGTDATRVWFAICDVFGAPTLAREGSVSVSLEGPGTLVGDQHFSMAETGGVGAVWVRGQRGAAGRLTVTFQHASLGRRSVRIGLEQLT